VPDLYSQSKSKQPTPIRETLISGRMSKSVPREAYDDHRAEVLGFVRSAVLIRVNRCFLSATPKAGFLKAKLAPTQRLDAN
jgi:hypothetical protein